MTSSEAERLALRFIAYLETGDPEPGLFCDDAFCDFTSPRWRCDPTPSGFVLEVEEEWQDKDDRWYCRELFRADVRGHAIAQLSVYCTGDWDSARRAQHAHEVRLLRP